MAKNEALHNDSNPSYKAAAALLMGTAVKLATARNTVEQATAATDETIGIVVADQATAGAPVNVKRGGYALALVGAGNWTKGAKLTPTTAGALIATTTAANKVVAIATEIATAGEYGEVLLLPFPVRYDSL